MLVAFFWFSMGPLAGQIQPTPSQTSAVDEAETLYRQALSSYLDGDYDKAIVATAQSLEKDPNFQKSKNLLTLLSAEKDNEGKTVIWLAGKHTDEVPVLTPPIDSAQPPSSLSPGELARLQAEITSVRTQENSNRRIQTMQAQQLAGQLDVIHDMVSINNSGQYQELRNSQVDLYQQVQNLNKARWGSLFWVVLLSLSSLAISLYSVWHSRYRKKAIH
jgi:TolA-binding protein